MKSFKSKNILLLMLILLTAWVFIGCTDKDTSEPISETKYFLGTVVSIDVFDHASQELNEEIFKRIGDLEDLLSINIPTSEVSKINDHAGIDFVSVSEDTYRVISEGLRYSKLSKGNFDISIGPMVKLWNIGSDKARVPSTDEITAALPLINFENVLLDPSKQGVMLKEKGMFMDLGGIAKGYVADEVAEILKSHRVKSAIINLGGNVLGYGSKEGKYPWKIGIQDPFSPRGSSMGVVSISNKSVVTSGIYERFFEENGKTYHHILSTQTGYPIENELAGVSIVAEKSVDADGLSTSLFALGTEQGLSLVENLPGVDAILITKDYHVYISSGLKDNFKIIDDHFKIIN